MAPKKVSTKVAAAKSSTGNKKKLHDIARSWEADDKADASIAKRPAGLMKRPAADTDGDAGRDRNKNYHFQRQFDEFPDYVKSMFKDASTSNQTVIINMLMQDDGTGKPRAANFSQPLFEDPRMCAVPMQHARVFVHMHMCNHVHIHLCKHVHIHLCLYRYTSVALYIYIYIYIYVYV